LSLPTLEKQSFCKVNLLLNILGKRPDGFHELETVMQPIFIFDGLTFARSPGGVTLACEDSTLPTDGRNLVVRAANAFFAEAKIYEGVSIHLRKRIPIAAGLGGGSGNAATTLLALNELFGNPLSSEVLHRLAAQLGSDIPFFLQSQPALGTGRGEKVTTLPSFPALRAACFVLAHPGFGVSTPWAYGELAHHPEALNGKPGRAQRLINLLQGTDLSAACAEFYNSLEAPVLKKHPLLQLFQEFFSENGAVGTLMSGSGSSTFAVFPSQSAAEQALDGFRSKFGAAIWTALLPAQSA
jgi:4-diphosphocytidyl-2-C-methyl-D-erythritol kinase